MKILWLCNLILPEIAEDLGFQTIPKEGWVKGLFDAITEKIASNNLDIEIAIAFPASKNLIFETEIGQKNGFISGQAGANKIKYYAFYEYTSKEDAYEDVLESEMQGIIEDFKPDVVHCFGTEFPHTLAAAKALDNPDRLLIGIQGPCTIYAEKYLSHLPKSVVNRKTFRDILKQDSIIQQKEKYVRRGINEREAIKRAGHIAGRTQFDMDLVKEWNPDATYHHAGETLRKTFYDGQWEEEHSEKYRLFVSQADYPLKGFHYLLIAVGELLNEDSCDRNRDIQIYVAGQSVVSYDTLKQKIKISSYGKYLRELIAKYDLKDRVHFLGRLSAEEMKEQYQLCDTYICCSACENSPNSLGEAMMLEVPIVAARVGGIASVFDINRDGFSYSCEDSENLEDVCANLKTALLERWSAYDYANKSDELNVKRRSAGMHARENHDPEKNALDMINIYKNICK